MNAIERLRAVIGPVYPGSDNARDLAAVDALYQAAKAVDGYGTSRQFDTRTSTLRELRAAVRRIEGEA